MRFHYECAEDWKQQFVNRPYTVRAVQPGHDSLALVESVGDTDRLQLLACSPETSLATIAALAAASVAQSRKFFMYTLDPLQAAGAKRIGLVVRAGYLMLLPTDSSSDDWHKIATATWSVQSGDRL